jgi:radical SAM superfamily enzyme YgiQ (UPF0313 family)
METVKLNRSIQPNSLSIYIFEAYPGTPLYDMSIENNFLTREEDGREYISRTDTSLTMPQFTRKQILKCYSNFAWRVYWKNSIKKALFNKVYYSRYGELLIRILAPLKKRVQKSAMN